MAFQSEKISITIRFWPRQLNCFAPHTHSHAHAQHKAHSTSWRPKTCTPERKTILLVLNSLDQIDYGFRSFLFFFRFLNTTSYIIIVNWWRPSKKLRKNERMKGEKKMCYTFGPITSMRHILTWFIDCNNICHTSYNQTVLHDKEQYVLLERATSFSSMFGIWCVSACSCWQI